MTDLSDGSNYRLEDILSALSAPRRLWLVECLRGTDAAMALADAARRIAADEADVRETEVGPEAVERVYVSLYHNHVPRLADAGVVTFDTDRNSVEPGENFEEAVCLLEAGVDDRPRS